MGGRKGVIMAVRYERGSGFHVAATTGIFVMCCLYLGHAIWWLGYPLAALFLWAGIATVVSGRRELRARENPDDSAGRITGT